MRRLVDGWGSSSSTVSLHGYEQRLGRLRAADGPDEQYLAVAFAISVAAGRKGVRESNDLIRTTGTGFFNFQFQFFQPLLIFKLTEL